jgi:hypothetical protein
MLVVEITRKRSSTEKGFQDPGSDYMVQLPLFISFFFLFVFFGAGSCYIAQLSLEPTLQPMLATNSASSCLILPSTEVTGLLHHAHPFSYLLMLTLLIPDGGIIKKFRVRCGGMKRTLREYS